MRQLADWKGPFAHAIADFSAAYADQNERDYAELEKAASDGRITVQSGL